MNNIRSSFNEMLIELGNNKSNTKSSWKDIAKYMNDEFLDNKKPDYYRKHYWNLTRRKKSDNVENNEDILEDLLSIKRERAKLSDEIVQNNAYIRQLSREETLKEIAKEYAEVMYKEKILETYNNDYLSSFSKNSAILQLSDWHYGLEINNYFNRFNPEICIKRVNELKNKVISMCLHDNVKTLYIANLSDLISGYIHLQLRLQNRYDVITQVMDVSEILAELLNDLSEYFNIEYYDCLDNHSRLDPNKKDSFHLESLVRITHWYLVERLKNNNKININNYSIYGEDIITFNCCGWDIAGVHGDNDTVQNIIERLSLMTHANFDLILTAHKHHFAAYEDNECIVLQNGSLMGTDYYATKLRKSSKPSQNLIIVSNENVVEKICKIDLQIYE